MRSDTSAVASIVGGKACDHALNGKAMIESTVFEFSRPLQQRRFSNPSTYASSALWIPGMRLCGMPRHVTGVSQNDSSNSMK